MTDSASTADSPTRDPVPVVGIGASAGGLDALRRLLAALPTETGLAFVIVQHLAPDQPSALAELLAPHTALPVCEAADQTRIAANTVYILPPGRDLILRDRTLHLVAPERSGGGPVSIDRFFRSLAEDLRDQAIGLILTGAGRDGTLGIQAIKEQGGLVLVQDPATAAVDGMPRSALATGLADAVLPIERMPEALLQLRHSGLVADGRDPPDSVAVQLEAILTLLQLRTRQSFRAYKRSTLVRRIQRRMSLCHVQDMGAYLERLRGDPAEQQKLVRDFLISVTRFFRDPEAFAVLAEQGIRPLVHGRDPGQPIRAWVPACATGEEAFSIAILLLEEATAAGWNGPLRVFASDIDEGALAVARAGLYPDTIAADVPVERLHRFFVPEGAGYRVIQPLREIVTVTTQNLLTDPPFSRLDLISCRNLLMYLEPKAQETVLGLLHFALREEGCLFLGSAETAGRQAELFTPLSKPAHLYRRIGPARPVVAFPVDGGKRRPLLPSAPPQMPPPPRPAELVHQRLIAAHAPPAVLIDRHGEALYFSGGLDRYLTMPAGEASLDLMAMTRGELRAALRIAVHQASQRGERVRRGGIPVPGAVNPSTVTVTVEPIGDANPWLLVTFEAEPVPPAGPAATPMTADDQAILEQLDRDLRTTREALQTALSDLDRTNEEYRASIEEAMSVNEELQSTNEELETSKEELQSINEEITTLNVELKQKVAELEAANNDLANLLASTDIATIFLSPDLRIRRFTPATQTLLSLLPSDLGRPLRDIAFRYADADLEADAWAVMARLRPIERRITAADGTCFIRRTLPYRTTDDRIDGVVITFTDVTTYRTIETALQDKMAELAAIMDAAPIAVWITHDPDCRRITGNRAGHELLRLPPAANLSKTAPAGERPTHFRVLKDGVEIPDSDLPLQRAARGEVVRDFEHELVFADGTCRTLLGTAVPRRDDQGQLCGAVAAFIDISERKAAECALAAAKTAAEQTSQAKTRFLASASHDLRQPLQAAALYLGILAGRSGSSSDPVLARLRESLTALEDLLTALLDLSKAEAGTLRLAPQDVPLGPLLAELAAAVAPRTTAKGVRCRVVDTVAVVHSDPVLLRRLLQNLFDNAVKYTPQGRILLGCRRCGPNVQIQIWDTGIGIPADELERIFEEFYQVGNVARDRRQGLGLGLAIVDRLARLLGHQITVRSTPGRGSLFAVEVPRAAAAPPARSTPATAAADRPLELDQAIVVIEDDPLVLSALQLQLEAWDCRVTAAPTAAAAWAALETDPQPPSLVLADLRLADGTSGIDAIRWLQARLSAPVRGVLLTGDTSPAQLQQAQWSGLHLLHKPVSPETLRAVLTQRSPDLPTR